MAEVVTLPRLTERRTSLADFYQIYKCGFCIASMPEWGLDRDGFFDPSGEGKQNFRAPVMSVVEEISSFLARSEETNEKPTVNNFVDFKDSANSSFCNSRIRWSNGDGNAILCADDFDRDLHDVAQGAETSWDEKQRFRTAVEHSAWFVYWNGKVAGGLSACLGSQADVELKDAHDSVWDVLFNGKSEINKDEDGKKFYCDMVDTQGPGFIRSPNRITQRTVVMISVDGGSVSQIEKQRLPSLAKSVLSDVRRRKYEWAGCCALFWVHFETVEDMLNSFAGVRNLGVDTSSEHYVMADNLAVVSTYQSMRDDGVKRPPCKSMLTCEPREVLRRSKGIGVTKRNFVAAILSDDPDTAQFILQRVDDPAEFLRQPCGNDFSHYSTLIGASRYGKDRSAIWLIEQYKAHGIPLDTRVESSGSHDDAWNGFSALGVAIAGACRAFGSFHCYKKVLRTLLQEGLSTEDAMGDGKSGLEYLREAIQKYETEGFMSQKNISRRNEADHEDMLWHLRDIAKLLEDEAIAP